MKQKNRWFEIGDLVGDFTQKLVTRMDGAAKYYHWFLKLTTLGHFYIISNKNSFSSLDLKSISKSIE